jgi:hypothetical protein
VPRLDPAPKAGNRPPDISQKALYGALPFDLAFDPRGHDLDPVELAVALALTASARRIIRHRVHVQAFNGYGQDAIKEERAYQEQHQREWQAKRKGLRSTVPIRLHAHKEPTYKAGRVRKNLKNAGRFGYSQATSTLSKQPLPEVIPVLISRSNLLRVANMSADGKNLTRLNRILRRLRKPVAQMPPLLASVEEQPSGLLLLLVCGAWLAPPFVQVPLPLPTRSRPATSLYLFLQCIQTRPMDRSDSSFKALCRRVGISASTPWVGRQAFQRALDIVNDHLRRLDGEQLRREFKIKMPAAYKVVKVDDGQRIRFEACARQRPLDDEEQVDAAVTRRRRAAPEQPLERVRVVLSEEDIQQADEDIAQMHRQMRGDQQRRKLEARRAALWNEP